MDEVSASGTARMQASGGMSAQSSDLLHRSAVGGQLREALDFFSALTASLSTEGAFSETLLGDRLHSD